jgi:hypothetical protein
MMIRANSIATGMAAILYVKNFVAPTHVIIVAAGRGRRAKLRVGVSGLGGKWFRPIAVGSAPRHVLQFNQPSGELQIMVAPAIDIPKQAVAEFCRRHGIRRLSLFGSVLRDDFRPDSDVDVLVEFQPDKVVGWEIVSIEDELSQLLGGRKVDMVRTSALYHRLKDRILASAQVQYEEG